VLRWVSSAGGAIWNGLSICVKQSILATDRRSLVEYKTPKDVIMRYLRSVRDLASNGRPTSPPPVIRHTRFKENTPYENLSKEARNSAYAFQVPDGE